MIILDKHRDTLKKFVEIFGTTDQLNKLVEEMGHLTATIHRYNRKINKCKNEEERKALQSDCEDKLAQVLVLTEQAKLILDESNISRFAEQHINKTKQKIML